MSLTDHDRELLAQAVPDLQFLFIEVAKIFPIKILKVFRDQVEQDAAYASGHSNVKWPNSKHNKYPSEAVDWCPEPYIPGGPIDWQNVGRFYFYAGFILGMGLRSGFKIRSGADWDTDGNIDEHKLKDLGHTEVYE